MQKTTRIAMWLCLHDSISNWNCNWNARKIYKNYKINEGIIIYKDLTTNNWNCIISHII